MLHRLLLIFVVEDVVEAVCEAAREVGVLGEAAGATHREPVREGDSRNLRWNRVSWKTRSIMTYEK